MENKNDLTRVGIYTQTSVETAATGAGFAPRGEKSPVVKHNQKPRGKVSKIIPKFRNNQYRSERYTQLEYEFDRLGFTKVEIKACIRGLEAERKARHNQNKMERYCQENNIDMETAKKMMLERKEREIAKYKAEKELREAQKLAEDKMAEEKIGDEKTSEESMSKAE